MPTLVQDEGIRSCLEQAAKLARDVLNKWAREYYVDNAPSVDDATYDKLFNQLKKLEALHPELITLDSPTQRVGAILDVHKLSPVVHQLPMLSLDNAMNAEAAQGFLTRICKELGIPCPEIHAQHKYDGLTVELVYIDGYLSSASTRGDGVFAYLQFLTNQ